MKRTKLFVGALALLTFCTPVMAQSFMDLPSDHWAYSAIEELNNKGYMVGYPDATFKGKQPLTRYEFALAVSRVVAQLTKSTPTGNAQADLQSLNNRISVLEGKAPATAAPTAAPADLEKITRLINEFRDELSTLGVDVDSLKRDVADLKTRTSAIEDQIKKMPKISVQSEFMARGETTRKGRILDQDGRTLDLDNNVLQGVRALYDTDIIINGNLGEKATASAVVNMGNYLNWLNNTTGSYSVYPGYYPSTSPFDASEEVSLYYAYFTAPVGKGTITAGKMPFQLTPYTFKMVDTDSYFTNWKTDSGDYPVIGAKVDYKVGPANVLAFAFRNPTSTAPYLVGPFGRLMVYPDLYTPLVVSQTAGARVSFKTPYNGTLGLNFLAMGVDYNYKAEADHVFGADLSLNPCKHIGFTGSWTKSNLIDHDSDRISVDDNTAWEGKLSTSVLNGKLSAGYREIGANFLAPGYWSTGSYLATNIVDVKGPIVDISVPVTSKLTANGAGEFYEGLGNSNTDYFTTVDKIKHYTTGVNYKLLPDTLVKLSWERFEMTDNPTNPQVKMNWYTLGVEKQFSSNTSLKVGYQFAGEDVNWRNIKRNSEGGIATTQFSVKF